MQDRYKQKDLEIVERFSWLAGWERYSCGNASLRAARKEVEEFYFRLIAKKFPEYLPRTVMPEKFHYDKEHAELDRVVRGEAQSKEHTTLRTYLTQVEVDHVLDTAINPCTSHVTFEDSLRFGKVVRHIDWDHPALQHVLGEHMHNRRQEIADRWYLAEKQNDSAYWAAIHKLKAISSNTTKPRLSLNLHL